LRYAVDLLAVSLALLLLAGKANALPMRSYERLGFHPSAMTVSSAIFAKYWFDRYPDLRRQETRRIGQEGYAGRVRG